MLSRRVLLAAVLPTFIPAALAAQVAPVRLPAGACDYQTRPGVAWAASVRAFSTQYDASSYAATQALGAPNVFPRYGDIPGAWAPQNADSPADYLEVLFAAPVMASELWVFESNGTGGTYGIAAINPDGSTTPLAVSQPMRLAGAASQIVVPVNPPRVVSGVRVEVSSAAVGTYAEIDAVAAAPLPSCQPGAVVAPVATYGTAVRLTPAQLGGLTVPPGAVFATAVLAVSSEYNSEEWSARQALGPPNVFPQHGDLQGTWAQASGSRRDSITLQFPQTMVQEIWVYETNGVGGLYRVDDVSSGMAVPLWAGTAAPLSDGQSRILRLTLAAPRAITALRLLTDPDAVNTYVEIDAVAVVPAAGGIAK